MSSEINIVAPDYINLSGAVSVEQQYTKTQPKHVMRYSYYLHVQPTFDSSYTDTSKYFLLSKNRVWTHFYFYFSFQLLLSQTTGISK